MSLKTTEVTRFDAADFSIDAGNSTVDEVTRLDIDAKTSAVTKNSADELCDVHFSATKILDCADKLLSELSPTHAKIFGNESICATKF